MLKIKFRFVTLLLFIVLLVLSGCENVDLSGISDEDLERVSEKLIVCNSPYMRVGAECCLDQNSNSICDRDETQKTELTETGLVREYLKHLTVQNIDEDIAAIKDTLNYATGYAEEDLKETLRYLNEQKRIFNEFYNEFGVKCKEIDTIEACKKAQESFLNTFNSAFKRDANIITVELKEKGKSVHTEREEITPTRKETVIKDYLLKKEGDEWKIYDWVDNGGNKWSDIPVKDIKLQNDNSIQELKKTYDWALQHVQEAIEKQAIQKQVVAKKDKCSYLDEQKGRTPSELDSEYGVCYQGKYTDYALATNDSVICEEIVKPWYLSPCIAAVASQKDDLNLCKNIKYEEWEARGYRNKLNTNDLCYYSFVTYKYTYVNAIEIENSCNKISDIQLKTQCLTFKELAEIKIEENKEEIQTQEQAKSYKKIATFTGKGNQDTESFKINSDKVKIVAKVESSIVKSSSYIELQSESDDALLNVKLGVKSLSILPEAGEEGYGETILRDIEKGDYYISVISGINWEVEVYEYS